MKNLRLHLLPLTTLTVGAAGAADLLWDGWAANMAAAGDGLSTCASCTWSTGIANRDSGAVPHVPLEQHERGPCLDPQRSEAPPARFARLKVIVTP